MRLRRVPVIVITLAGLAVGGCARPAGQGGTEPGTGPGTTTGAAPPATETAGTNPTVAAPPATEPTIAGLEYRVSYNWGVPSNKVTIPHSLKPPIGPPSAPPLPYLVAVYVGDHPEASPKYQRVSFYFRGAFPEYNFQYVRQVTQDGTGNPVALQGNSFLNIVFTPSQAHDNAGAATVKATPKNPIGFKNLKSYAFAGDYEGYVTYGLGIQVAPGSDQVLKIRAGELKRPDGSGGFFYVVHFDVQTG